MDQTLSSFFPWKKETNQSETCPLLRILHFWNISLPLKMRFLLGNEGLSSLNASSKWDDRVLAWQGEQLANHFHMSLQSNIWHVLKTSTCQISIFGQFYTRLTCGNSCCPDNWGKNKMKIFWIAVVFVCWVLWVTLRLGAYEGTFTWAEIFLQNFCRMDYLHLCRAKRWQNIRCIARLSAVYLTAHWFHGSSCKSHKSDKVS